MSNHLMIITFFTIPYVLLYGLAPRGIYFQYNGTTFCYKFLVFVFFTFCSLKFYMSNPVPKWFQICTMIVASKTRRSCPNVFKAPATRSITKAGLLATYVCRSGPRERPRFDCLGLGLFCHYSQSNLYLECISKWLEEFMMCSS
jgi:hypothetical protein